MSLIRKILITSVVTLIFLSMFRVHTFAEFRPLESYLSFFSLYQNWLIVSPAYKEADYVIAEVEFEDGSKASYDFEHHSKESFLARYSYGAKFQRFVKDGLLEEGHEFMRVDAAKFALRKLKDTNFHKIPLRVHLIRHSEGNLEKFYTYEVL